MPPGPAVRHNKQILVDIAMLTENIKQEEPKRVLRDYGDEGDCKRVHSYTPLPLPPPPLLLLGTHSSAQ